jgi:outer membrane protein assembly factor BamB
MGYRVSIEITARNQKVRLKESIPVSLVLLFLLLDQCTPVAAQDYWPEFRGPTGDGQASGNPPLVWSESRNIRWKTEIHGRGWSSPVVWQNRIWLTTATEDGKKMYAICVDRSTGQIVHDLCVFENENPQFCHPTNSYASPTPAIDGERVYVHFGSYGTAAIDTESGKVVWRRRDLPCDHWRGPGSSPILYQDRLFVAFDGYDYQYVVALDTRTGQTVWRKDRNIDYQTTDGDYKKAYSTASIAEDGGRIQLVSPSAVETIAYDVANGEELWRIRHGGMNAAARPVFGNGVVYIAIGDAGSVAGPSMIAVRMDGKGDVSQTHVVWSMKTGGPKRPSLLLQDEHLFMVADEGVARCLNASTGETIWKERLAGTFRASPVLANGRIYFFSLEGSMPVVEASPKFKLLADNELENGCQASPAAVGDSLYVRTTRHLYCIQDLAQTGSK